MQSVADKIHRFTEFVWDVTLAWMRHDIPSLSAVIAFYAFFSLFPLLLLIIYGASVLIPHTPVETFLFQIVRPYFPALPDAQKFITDNISHMIAIGPEVGLFSAVTLIWSATNGFIAVQQALDVIWEVKQPRSFVTRRVVAFSMLLVLFSLTLLSAVWMTILPILHHSLSVRLHLSYWTPIVHRVSHVLFPLSLFLGCVVFYRYLPSQKTTGSYVVCGAFVATLLLDIGRYLFVWYAIHLARYYLIYGTITIVMILVLWMYLASIILLFGAEFSARLQACIEKP